MASDTRAPGHSLTSHGPESPPGAPPRPLDGSNADSDVPPAHEPSRTAASETATPPPVNSQHQQQQPPASHDPQLINSYGPELAVAPADDGVSPILPPTADSPTTTAVSPIHTTPSVTAAAVASAPAPRHYDDEKQAYNAEGIMWPPPVRFEPDGLDWSAAAAKAEAGGGERRKRVCGLRRRLLVAAIVGVVVVAIALGVGLGVGLRKSDDKGGRRKD